jgi:NADH-quinone oxidoreductase subunit L
MCFIVTFVGSLVFLYAIGYMRGDPGFNRFFTYLSLFAFMMLVLVLADSYPLMFLGWEGVGLCSYLLIGYYLNMPGAPDAGKKAFIVNRIGDFGFLIATFLIFQYCGTLAIAPALSSIGGGAFAAAPAALTAVALLLLLGCAGKSAQIPLFIWLPDAMAGPTPVSALIHAATMVTAGVYLVARNSVLFALSPDAMLVMAVVGAATAFVAGVTALTQRDIKKVLAYSTVSQLGYMFLACGVGAFGAAIFHVFTHAFFKACLFLGAGAVIHSAGGERDLFKLGGLRKHLKWVYFTYLAASLAIVGFPLTAGFFSKDEILWRTFSAAPMGGAIFGSVPLAIPLYVVGAATAVLTAIYTFRAAFLAFYGAERLPEPARSHVHAPDWTMTVPLMILGAGSLVVGFLNLPHAIGGHAAFETFLGGVMQEADAILAARAGEAHHGSGAALALMGLSAALAIGGIAIARHLFLIRWPDKPAALAARFPVLHQLSRSGWWWDMTCGVVFAGGVKLLAALSVLFDRWIIDGLLHVAAELAREASRNVRRMQYGQVQAYALAVLLGANLLLLLTLIWG